MHGVLIFLAAGFLHPGVVRILYFKGMEEVGASANASIFATYPLFSTVIAMLLIGERPQVKVLAGALCVVVGA
ncbi:MAG: EamA family transporter, partial [Thermoproteota archaeon]